MSTEADRKEAYRWCAEAILDCLEHLVDSAQPRDLSEAAFEEAVQIAKVMGLAGEIPVTPITPEEVHERAKQLVAAALERGKPLGELGRQTEEGLAVKLQRFMCVRYEDGAEAKAAAEKTLRAEAAKHFGVLWPRVEHCYVVAHTEQPHRCSTLSSADEHAVLLDGDREVPSHTNGVTK